MALGLPPSECEEQMALGAKGDILYLYNMSISLLTESPRNPARAILQHIRLQVPQGNKSIGSSLQFLDSCSCFVSGPGYWPYFLAVSAMHSKGIFKYSIIFRCFAVGSFLNI